MLLRNAFAASWITLGLGCAHQGWAAANPTPVVGRIAATGANGTQDFFNQFGEAIDTFFDNPRLIFVHRKGRYTNDKPTELARMPLCRFTFGDEQVNRYSTSSDPVARKNFWVVAAMCLAAHEGAEAMIDNRMSQFNKNDTAAAGGKFLYGTFQLDAMIGGGVKHACVPSWEATRGGRIDTSSWNRDGTQRRDSADKLMGNPEDQTFNIYCGIHELFRASSTSGPCLNPFRNHDGNNRYGGLRTGSKGYKKCVQKWGGLALEAKSYEALKASIAEAYLEEREKSDRGPAGLGAKKMSAKPPLKVTDKKLKIMEPTTEQTTEPKLLAPKPACDPTAKCP